MEGYYTFAEKIIYYSTETLLHYFKYIHFYFLLPISRESIVWGTNFRSGDFDGLTRFEVP